MCYLYGKVDQNMPTIYRIFFLMLFALPLYSQEQYTHLRQEMVNKIQTMVRDTSDYTGKQQLDSRVLDAVSSVPRHEFVPENLRDYAYINRPLPIGEDQTISQPYIVALMTDLAMVDKESVVLEIGTGSGYQAAILAELADHVYTIEIIDKLAVNAKKTLDRLGYQNITVKAGDGYHGWRDAAPFDAILVTAAPEQVPEPLIAQLKPQGRMIIPVGEQGRTQSLRVIEKSASGKISEWNVLSVVFVPLTREP